MGEAWRETSASIAEQETQTKVAHSSTTNQPCDPTGTPTHILTSIPFQWQEPHWVMVRLIRLQT